MQKQKLLNFSSLSLLLIVSFLGSIFSLFSDPTRTVTKKQAELINSNLKGIYKIYYYCDTCPGSKVEIKIISNFGYESIRLEDGFEYNFYINEKEYLNPEFIYVLKDSKWQNLGILTGIGGNVNVLPESKYPLDLENVYNQELVQASDTSELSILEKKLSLDINELRTNPKGFAEKIQSNLKYLKSGVWKFPDRRPYRAPTDEKGYLKVIDNLKSQAPVPPLSINENLLKGTKKNRLEPSANPLYTRYNDFIEKPEYLHMYEISQSGTIVSVEILSNLLAHDWNKYSKVIFDDDFQHLGLSCGPVQNTSKCLFLLTAALKPPPDLQKALEEFVLPSDVSYLSVLEKNIIEETNLLRSNPKEYAKYLKEIKIYYKGTFFKKPILAPMSYTEGIKAVDEAISVLEKSEPVNILQMNEELSRSSRDHVKDTGYRGITGHTGADGSSPLTRMQRYKKNIQVSGENIAYGYNTARDIVMQLFIDDAVYDRGHRKNLMFSDFKYIGTACGPHKGYKIMCVQNFGDWDKK